MHQWDESPKTGGTVDQSWLTSTAIGQAISRIHHHEQVEHLYPPNSCLLRGLLCSSCNP